MPYCRNCGSKLEEDAKFCRVCGAPVAGANVPSAASIPRPVRRRNILPVAILAGLLILAFFFSVFAFVPFRPVDFSQSNSVAGFTGVNVIKLNFDADAANVRVIPAELPGGQLARLDVFALGSIGLFGSASKPVTINLTEQKLGNTLDVTAKVNRADVLPFSYGLNVTCNFYVSRSNVLDVTAQTSVGEVILNADAPVTFDSLVLRSSTGSVQAAVSDGVLLAGNFSATTTTGSVQFTWNNGRVSGNTTFSLGTTTGSVKANVTQNRDLGGNVALSASTTTGSVDFNLAISDSIGAKITSATTTGGISTDVQNFNGNKSPIYSSNYPADNNFIANLTTVTGSIHIKAVYQGNDRISAQA